MDMIAFIHNPGYIWTGAVWLDLEFHVCGESAFLWEARSVYTEWLGRTMKAAHCPFEGRVALQQESWLGRYYSRKQKALPINHDLQDEIEPDQTRISQRHSPWLTCSGLISRAFSSLMVGLK